MGRAGRAPKQAVAATDDVDQNDANDTKCERCGLGDDEPNLVLCDDCPRGWHVYCLRPKLPHVPRGVVVVPPVRARGDGRRRRRRRRSRVPRGTGVGQPR